MTSHGRLAELRAFSVFEGFSDLELQRLAEYVREESVPQDAFVLREGDESRSMYFVVEGTLEVHKASAQEDQRHRIHTLEAGAVFGELVFLDERQTRSTSIKACGEVRLLSLSPEEFEQFRVQEKDSAHRFLKNVGILVGRRLRDQTENVVATLERELEHAEERVSMGRFMSYVILLLFGYNLFVHNSIELSKNTLNATLVSVAIIFVFGIVLAYLIRGTGRSYASYGLTTKGWRRALGESLLATLGFCVLLTALKWVLIETVFKEHDLALIDPYYLEFTPRTALTLVTYALFSPVQEFIARGAIQSSLQRFYIGRHRVLLAILVSNCLFGAAHVHLSSTFAAAVFLPGLVWGYLFARHGTLIGVSLSHILVGWYAVYFLRLTVLSRLA